MKFFSLIISLGIFVSILNSQSIPELIQSSENKGRCPYTTEKGFSTYTWDQNGKQRCFSMYIPENVQQPAPLLIHSNCYARDGLNGLGMSSRSKLIKAANQYGFAVIGVSTPDGGWQFPNDGIINSQNPTPCEEKDSKDIQYMDTIFEFIQENSDQLDNDKIYAEGFSQNSMWSIVIGVCYRDMIKGVWQGGSGLGLTGLYPTLPGAQAECKRSDFDQYQKSCFSQTPCQECEYWPIYPAKDEKNTIRNCIMSYDNDGVACGTHKYMFDAMVAEGHDARLFTFLPSNGIQGSHKNPKEEFDWIVGCLGITQQCSQDCENSFLKCTQSGDYETCNTKIIEGNLQSCPSTCSKTLEMLKQSETPIVSLSQGRFGNQEGLTVDTQGLNAKCSKGRSGPIKNWGGNQANIEKWNQNGNDQNNNDGGNKPDNGGNKPDNGGNKPDNGGNKPDNGGNKPDNGANKPDNGGNKPDNGGNKPDNGGSKPDNGGQKPDNGNNKPDNGNNKPDNGGQKPNNGGDGPDNGSDTCNDQKNIYSKHAGRCAVWAENGYCKSGRFTKFMTRQCALSCCKSENGQLDEHKCSNQGLQDEHVWCHERADIGHCKYAAMKEKCPLSCCLLQN